MYIVKSKKDQRIAHWKEIHSRITTHEGELLTGARGIQYQEKYGEKYLGKKMNKPVNYNQVSYLQELDKTK